MTIPPRDPPSLPRQFRVSGFDFEKGSKINPPSLCGDLIARQIFVRLVSGTFLSGLQKKPIETL
jgi:hypothetical protein